MTSIATFNRRRWRHSRPTPSTDVYEAPEYRLDISQPVEIDEAKAARELAHARQQEALAATYPGRPPRSE